MAMTEKNALGRVLMVSKTVYADIGSGAYKGNAVALLDSLSAALSHCGSDKKPLGKLMRTLYKEIKSADKLYSAKVKPLFAKIYPVLDYDFDKAARHVPAIIYGNDKICAKLVAGEIDKAKSMCDAMKSYPGFLFGEFESLSDRQFYDLVFGYYPKLYEEPFMEEMERLFAE